MSEGEKKRNDVLVPLKKTAPLLLLTSHRLTSNQFYSPPFHLPLFHFDMLIRGQYYLIPLIASCFWLATLLGLLLWWAVEDNAEQYQISQTTVVYISNVGAAHKAFFIAGCSCTFVLWSLTLITERWLRHIRRIPGALQKKERIYDILSVVFGILGGLALVMLSIFDAVNHSRVHWSMTLVFVVCIALSAIFQTLEVMSLERDHVERKHLRRAAIIKLSIMSTAVAGAIAFGATYAVCSGRSKTSPPSAKCERVGSAAAVLEWFIAFLFWGYILTFVVDLWPAHKTRGHKFHPDLIEADKQNTLHRHADGRPGAPGLETPPRTLGGSDNDADSLGPRIGRPSEDQRMRQEMRQV